MPIVWQRFPLFAYSFSYSLKKFLLFAIYSLVALIIGLYLYRYSQQARNNLSIALRVLIGSLVIMEAITIFNVLSGFDLLYYISHGIKRAQGGNYHLREVFSVMIFFLVLDFTMRRGKIWNLLLLAIPVFGILASTSRTAILTLFVVALLYTVAKTKRLFSKELALLLGVILLTTAVAYKSVPEIKQRLDTFKTTFLSSGDRMSHRYDVYMTALKRIKNNPIVGLGVKSGVVLAKEGKWFYPKLAKHPHNIYLQVLVDSGIVGFAGFLVFLYYLFGKIFRPYLKEPVVVAVFGAIFLTSLVSWSIWSVNHISLVLALLVMLYSYVVYAKGEGLDL